MAVRWYLAYPLSSRQVLELLAERGIDVSHRTTLTWVQVFRPLLLKSDDVVGWASAGSWTRSFSSARARNGTCIGRSTRTV